MPKGVRIKIKDIDRGYNRLKRLFETYQRRNSYAKVGLLGSETADNAGDLTQAEIGAVHEFGTEDGRIPRRPWISAAFDLKKDELLQTAQKLILMLMDGKITMEKALGILGLKLSTEIKKYVTTGDPIPPPNAPSVQKAKEAKTRSGAAHGVRTLIDTGRMVASVTWAVIIERKA